MSKRHAVKTLLMQQLLMLLVQLSRDAHTQNIVARHRREHAARVAASLEQADFEFLRCVCDMQMLKEDVEKLRAEQPSATMKTFLVYRIYDQTKLEEKAALMKEHHAYQDSFTSREQLPSIKIAFKGVDGVGAYHFILADDESQVRTLIEGDPHCKAKIYNYSILEVTKLRGSW